MELQLIVGTKPAGEFKPKCCVQLDDKKESFTSFVAICNDEKTGKTTILQNTDAVTLGQGLQLITLAFKEAYAALTQPERELVDSVLRV